MIGVAGSGGDATGAGEEEETREEGEKRKADAGGAPLPDGEGEHAPGGDAGLATVWVAMTTATLCVVFAIVLALGQVVVVRHRAGGAADLAALAAADRALGGAEQACRAAEKVAAAQGATVVRCAVRGEIADVTARVALGPYEPEVRSRAGPPQAPPPEPPMPAPGPGSGDPEALRPGALHPGTPGSQASRAPPVLPVRPSSSGFFGFSGYSGFSRFSGSGGADRRSSPRRRTAPRLCKGSLPLPHLGDWMQEGQPASHSQDAMA